MLVSFDTEKEDLEQLKKVLEILCNEIVKKNGGQHFTISTGGNSQTQTSPQQPIPSSPQNNIQQQPKLTSIQAQQAQAILSAASKVDMSKIYQSNAGIQKRREERYRHNY